MIKSVIGGKTITAVYYYFFEIIKRERDMIEESGDFIATSAYLPIDFSQIIPSVCCINRSILLSHFTLFLIMTFHFPNLLIIPHFLIFHYNTLMSLFKLTNTC